MLGVTDFLHFNFKLQTRVILLILENAIVHTLINSVPFSSNANLYSLKSNAYPSRVQDIFGTGAPKVRQWIMAACPSAAFVSRGSLIQEGGSAVHQQ